VAQLVAPLILIHVVSLPDPYGLPYKSPSYVVDKQYVILVMRVILYSFSVILIKVFTDNAFADIGWC